MNVFKNTLSLVIISLVLISLANADTLSLDLMSIFQVKADIQSSGLTYNNIHSSPFRLSVNNSNYMAYSIKFDSSVEAGAYEDYSVKSLNEYISSTGANNLIYGAYLVHQFKNVEDVVTQAGVQLNIWNTLHNYDSNVNSFGTNILQNRSWFVNSAWTTVGDLDTNRSYQTAEAQDLEYQEIIMSAVSAGFSYTAGDTSVLSINSSKGYRWDLLLVELGSNPVVFSSTNSAVPNPEPSTFLLLGFGLLTFTKVARQLSGTKIAI